MNNLKQIISDMMYVNGAINRLEPIPDKRFFDIVEQLENFGFDLLVLEDQACYVVRVGKSLEFAEARSSVKELLDEYIELDEALNRAFEYI